MEAYTSWSQSQEPQQRSRLPATKNWEGQPPASYAFIFFRCGRTVCCTLTMRKEIQQSTTFSFVELNGMKQHYVGQRIAHASRSHRHWFRNSCTTFCRLRLLMSTKARDLVFRVRRGPHFGIRKWTHKGGVGDGSPNSTGGVHLPRAVFKTDGLNF
jgi:hypothetical protein